MIKRLLNKLRRKPHVMTEEERKFAYRRSIAECVTSSWYQWPQDVPFPTYEEYEKAVDRYHEEIKENNARLKAEGKGPDISDWGCGLSFVMATYNRKIWWHLFFPEQKEEVEKQFIEEIKAAMNDRLADKITNAVGGKDGVS
jgi:hypothetical protein